MTGRCFLLLSFTLIPALASAHGVLEIPQRNSFQAGVGVVSGWKCTAGTITVSFDGGPPIPAVYGSDRADTQPVCGDTDNGFVLSWNWNLLGDGRHAVAAFDNGVLFAYATFTVVTPGAEFFTTGRATVTVPNFPRTGETTTLRWQESTQSFVMVAKSPVDVRNIAGTYQYAGSLDANTCAFPPPGTRLTEAIHVSQQGAALTATTALAGGVQLSGHIEPDQTFVLFSNPRAAPSGDGCTQTLALVVEGNLSANSVDLTFDYDFTGPCPAAACKAIFLGSWAKER
ncbi:MAG: hypothetical protein AB1671_14370 [Thermodesulfobacteriota bacterium]|jgi:hypothetical protein